MLKTIKLDTEVLKTKNPELIGYEVLDYLDRQRKKNYQPSMTIGQRHIVE